MLGVSNEACAMNVVFRVDASTSIGLGHVMRCRTLAQALTLKGAQVMFICRKHPGNQIDWLRSDGFVVLELLAPETCKRIDDGDYANWLGVPQDVDASESLNALSQVCTCLVPNSNADQSVCMEREETSSDARADIDWLIIDHYSLDETWERKLRALVGQIMVIDDLADRKHDCDLLLDQNFSSNVGTRYSKLLPANARRLLGPRYALLRPEYAKVRQDRDRCRWMVELKQPVSRVLVFFGGTDPENLTGRVLVALSSPGLCDLMVDVVVGGNNPHLADLQRQAEVRGRVYLHPPQLHLADLMANADLAIGAGGATTWERCCTGLPSLVISIADNQRPACEALASTGVIRYLGHRDEVLPDGIAAALLQLVDNPDERAALAKAGADLVDGLGVDRVMRAMGVSSEPAMGDLPILTCH